ncbi:MAG: FAD-dependent oxidoreductase [Anaerolineaceae bacterium]|nr:FAD-dependent oxidoreductase [Anaerolineaceae bacterium]
MSKENEGTGINRRDFLKASAFASAVGVAGIAGCKPKLNAAEKVGETSGEALLPSQQKWSFETPPEKISASKIVETIDVDVAVLGSGIAGVCAALAAAEKGANTLVLEKREVSTFHGGWCGVLDSRRQKELGIEFDKEEVISEIMRWGAYQPDQRLVREWANESGRVMDRLLDLADQAGIETVPDGETSQTNAYKDYDVSLRFLPAWNATLVPMVEQAAKAAGAKFMFDTPAKQLIKDDDGVVRGVIAEGLDGYIQVNAKAVIICTGGYEHDNEMLAKYMPRALNAITNWYSEGSTTGDGIKMGMWVGGAMQDGGHCPMFFDGGYPEFPLPISLARQPWLNVNQNGERFINEDAPFAYTCNQDLKQPGHMKWSVWDGKWEEEAPLFEGSVCERMVPPLWTPEVFEGAKQMGFIIQADTLEELAQKMEVPSDTFKATVDRYNELTGKGVDEDFGKHASLLTRIEEAPFFASKSGAALVVTLDGLQITPDMQVLDTEGKVIPGLFAAGNASGNFFCNDYAITVIGSSHGRALTFGWLAGEKAAAI